MPKTVTIPKYELAPDVQVRPGYTAYRASATKGVRAAGLLAVRVGSHEYTRHVAGQGSIRTSEPAVYVYYSPSVRAKNGDITAPCPEPFMVNGKIIRGTVQVEFVPSTAGAYPHSPRISILGVSGHLHSYGRDIAERTDAGRDITDALAEAVALEVLSDVSVLSERLESAEREQTRAHVAMRAAIEANTKADARVMCRRLELISAREAVERAR